MIVSVPEKDRWCGAKGEFVWWKGVRVTKASERVNVGVWWLVQKRQIRSVSGEARHGQGIVGTRSIVINNVVNGRGSPMEFVTAKEWEERAFAILIAKLYKNG
ncbi:hypothetical protein Tco_0983516 [Tanacetum coccineum]